MSLVNATAYCRKFQLANRTLSRTDIIFCSTASSVKLRKWKNKHASFIASFAILFMQETAASWQHSDWLHLHDCAIHREKKNVAIVAIYAQGIFYFRILFHRIMIFIFVNYNKFSSKCRQRILSHFSKKQEKIGPSVTELSKFFTQSKNIYRRLAVAAESNRRIILNF